MSGWVWKKKFSVFPQDKQPCQHGTEYPKWCEKCFETNHLLGRAVIGIAAGRDRVFALVADGRILAHSAHSENGPWLEIHPPFTAEETRRLEADGALTEDLEP